MEEINNFVSKFLSQRFQTFEPEKFKGSPALVFSEGSFKSVKLSSINSVATLCSVEELSANKIKCGVTFNDLKTWGFDEVLCIEETCVGSGSKIYGGPMYAPNSSVCLAAEHIGLFRAVDKVKLVKISESD
jgi:hypothetical protein